MRRFRLGIGMLLILLLIPWTSAMVHAETNTIQLMLEGQTLKPDVPPKLVQGRTMVPIRIVAEELGAEVGWDNQQRKVSIKSNAVDLTMHIGQKKAIVNGKEVAMDVPPMLDKGRTLVPLRFVGESLGTTIGWEQDTRTVIVNQTYPVEANGKSLSGQRVFKIGNEYYFPLKEISPFLGAVFQSAEMDQVDRLIYGDLNLNIEERGRTQLHLRRLDSGWVVPQSVIENLFQAKVVQADRLFRIEKLSRLQSVQEVNGKIVIKSTAPMPLQHFLMEAPHRLVIDLPNTIISEELKETAFFNGGTGIIRKASTVSVSGITSEPMPLEEPLSSEELSTDTPVETQPLETSTEKMVDIELPEMTPSLESQSPRLSHLEQEELIKEIRFSQFSLEPQTVRIVVELSRRVKYDLNPGAEGWEVALHSLPKKEGFLIMLDPGHGGKDPGAKGVSSNREKDLTLTISTLLKEELRQYKGLQVIETRSDDSYPTLQDRVLMANEIQADLFLSIHANAFKPETRGTETYYHTAQSEQFAKIVHKHLLEATRFPDRGAKKAGYYVIKNTTMPSALIEIGFLTHAEENRQMLEPAFQKRVAQALGKAIHEYYTSYQ
ncbi:N-acetylmuramoyl-L-alanine amidase [Ammoniphilus sp. CFH 90114]|uniref:N-acetylmuramoyl-L-alanine amidase n=1 Tax=Ammoniphilus sp. CFH 90114 TaxID=2493665 RepID=UPI00100FD89D|nr:N-acetylmuramoyl-L-alanine amidase [Ammoniphilus sp. CFH 90114]RXT14933.1 AMIN domain-containing protein [Ammoniphilus sp. CFH 90114]